MDSVPSVNTIVISGLIAGVAGFLTFLVIHHFWILPIWFILPVGLPIAGLGGIAVSWSYSILFPGSPRLINALAIFALVALILAPSIALSTTRPALFDLPTGSLLPGVTTSDAIRRFLFELILPSIIMGGIVGALIGRSWKAALVTALAGFVFALGPGHNIPFLAGTPAIPKGTILLFASTAVSSLALVFSLQML